MFDSPLFGLAFAATLAFADGALAADAQARVDSPSFGERAYAITASVETFPKQSSGKADDFSKFVPQIVGKKFDPRDPDRKKRDGESAFLPVGMLLRNNGSGRNRRLCSGTLVHPRFFLTAAHCFIGQLDGVDRYARNRFVGFVRNTYRHFEDESVADYSVWKVFLPEAGLLAIRDVHFFCGDPANAKACGPHRGHPYSRHEPTSTDILGPHQVSKNDMDLALVELTADVVHVPVARLLPPDMSGGMDPRVYWRSDVDTSGPESGPCYAIDQGPDNEAPTASIPRCVPLNRIHCETGSTMELENKIAKEIGLTFPDVDGPLEAHVFGQIPSHAPGTSGVYRIKYRNEGIDKKVRPVALTRMQAVLCHRPEGTGRCTRLYYPSCLVLANMVLEDDVPVRSADYVCQGDSGGGIFARLRLQPCPTCEPETGAARPHPHGNRYLVGVFSFVGQSNFPYEFRRCLGTEQAEVEMPYLWGVYAEWIRRVIGSTDGSALVLPPRATVAGVFPEQTRFRANDEAALFHVYEVAMETTAAAACEDDPPRPGTIVVTLNGYIGQGYSTVFGGRYEPSDLNLYLRELPGRARADEVRKGELERNVLLAHVHEEGEKPHGYYDSYYQRPSPKQQARLACVSDGPGTFAACKVRVDDLCSKRWEARVERVSGFGEYQVTVTIAQP